MITFEKKLDAVMRYITSENDAERFAIRAEIQAMLTHEDVLPVDRGLEYDVRRVLLDIGTPESLIGHRYLVRAICLVVCQPELLQMITKQLYPEVAKAFNQTPGRVERSIRHAIEVAWERGDLDTLMRYFGNTVSPIKGKPTNREFIARVSNVIRLYAK